MNKRIRFYLLIGALLLTALLRIECIFMPVIDHLESLYSCQVSQVMAGERLYKDMFVLKMPFAILPIHLVYLIFGRNNLLALHIFSIFWAVSITFIVFKMVQYAYNWRIGIISAYLFAIFSAALNVSGGGILPKSLTFMSFESEFTFCLPFTLACFMFLKSVRTKKNIFTFLTGFFWGLSLSVHPKAGTLLFVIVAYFIVLVLHPKYSMTWVSAIKQLWLIFLSTIVGLIPMVVYLISIKSLSGLIDFYFYSTTYVGGTVRDIFSFFSFKRFFSTIYHICIKNNYLLWVLAGTTIGISVFRVFRNILKHHKSFSEEDDPHLLSNIFFILCFLSSFIGIFANAPRFWRQNYCQMFPFVMILGGYGLWSIWNRVKEKKIKLTKVSLIIIVIAGIIYPIYVNQIKQIKSIKKVRRYLHYPIFDYVKKNTDINDRIYTWGCFYDIYTLTNRVASASDHMNLTLIGIRPTFPPTFGEVEARWVRKFLALMNKKKPKIIIDPTNVDKEPRKLYGGLIWIVRWKRFPPMKKVPFLWKFVKENYYLKEYFDEFAIYELKSEENGKN